MRPGVSARCPLSAMLFLGAFLVADVATAQQPPTATEAEVRRCLNCHGQGYIATLTAEQRSAMVSGVSREPRTDSAGLYFPRTAFERSVHARLSCQDCHPGSDQLPHAADLPDPACRTCHPVEAELHSRGVHAHKHSEANGDVPRCWDCHGGHDVLPPTDRNSHTYPLNVLVTCSGCHSHHGVSPNLKMEGQDLVDHYMDSVHGRAVQGAGLAVAATCPDCHRAHDIRPSNDPASSVHRNHVPDTCGRCHVGIEELCAGSIHFERKENGEADERRPVCTSCHTAHAITRVSTPSFSRDIVEECGLCHEELYATYRESYHGQVNRLGYGRAARCSDCHGSHEVRPASDPDSLISEQNLIATCGRCHPGATANFVKFMPHADYRNYDKSPLLFCVWLYFVVLISATFTGFGLHSVLWLTRSTVSRLRHGPRPHEDDTKRRALVRFRPIHRLTHALVITSFIGLTLTGIPLKFSDQPWALALSDALGGGNVAGILHRIFAVVMFAYVIIHVWTVIGWMRTKLRNKERGWLFGPESLLPRWKDLGDIIGMIKWFFGRGRMPRFDRWTYWEKFDYWADVVGTVIIGGSGLVLAFPIAASWILPGWLFNVAMIAHGYEALLAICFIFTIHFFNAHLRVEKFPADMVIFTGQLSEDEMREERPVEYERLVEAGELEPLVTEPMPASRHRVIRVLAVALMLIGFTVVGLILWAVVTSLDWL